MTLGERIKHVRLISGKLTMEQFGKRLGLTPAAISQFESGKANPSEQTLRSICREFDISEDWLKRGIGDVAPKTYESELERVIKERGLRHEDYVAIRNYVNLPQKARDVVTMFMINFTMDMQPQAVEPRNVHDWTPDELIEEATRQVRAEEADRKKGTTEPCTGSPKESGADCA